MRLTARPARSRCGDADRSRCPRRIGPDLLAVTEEDYLRPGCEGQGSLQTWRITDERNADGTIKLELLDLWTTELNELMDGTGRSNPLGLPTTVNCSAHWFDGRARSSRRAGTTRACASSTSRTRPRSSRSGYYVNQGEFWAAYFAPSDPRRTRSSTASTWPAGSTC